VRSLGDSFLKIGPDWRTLLSALLVAAAFPPWDFEFLSWFALVPWLSRLASLKTYSQCVLQGFWLSFTVGILVAHWLSVAAHEFLALSWPLSVLMLLVFAATCLQPQFLLFAALFKRATKTLGTTPRGGFAPSLCVGLALAYCGLDWLTPKMFDVGLGYALHEAVNLRQLAELGGVALLTFLIVLVNIISWRIASLWLTSRRGSLELLSCAVLIPLLLGGALGFGLLRNRELVEDQKNPNQVLRVGLAQGNVANEVRLAWAGGDDRAAEKQLSAYMLLTERFIAQTPRPDIVVWPEATFPGVFQKPTSKLQRGRATKFDRQVLRLNVPIVFGTYDLSEQDGHFTLFNSLMTITPRYKKIGSMGFVQRYHKHKLLAFAETVPGLSEVEWLRRLMPSLASFGRGPGAKVLEIFTPGGGSVLLAPSICSESLYPQHAIDGARNGGELIINIGSDGWFGQSGEPQFHLAISKFRSIETRLPQVRAANTGISALILPDGSIAHESALGTQQILNLEVPVLPARETLMIRWGDWFGPTALVSGLGLLSMLLALDRKSAG
jgi:apolipoprotein N-acyltransferase